eukprot:Amastigsp_a175801_86.p2 type:complete len:173 gc:universal Amastigsp_a175801_86:235-753(+)
MGSLQHRIVLAELRQRCRPHRKRVVEPSADAPQASALRRHGIHVDRNFGRRLSVASQQCFALGTLPMGPPRHAHVLLELLAHERMFFAEARHVTRHQQTARSRACHLQLLYFAIKRPEMFEQLVLKRRRRNATRELGEHGATRLHHEHSRPLRHLLHRGSKGNTIEEKPSPG